MFGRKKKQKEQKMQQVEQPMSTANKMDEAQKEAFMAAMKAPNAEYVPRQQQQEQEEPRFTTRMERHAVEEGYNQQTKPIAIQPEVVQEMTKDVEEPTISFDNTTFKTDITEDKLYDALEEVQDYNGHEFTRETWLPFVNAFTQALTVYQKEEPTAEEMLVAYDALKAAKAQLQHRED